MTTATFSPSSTTVEMADAAMTASSSSAAYIHAPHSHVQLALSLLPHVCGRRDSAQSNMPSKSTAAIHTNVLHVQPYQRTKGVALTVAVVLERLLRVHLQ